MKQFIIGDLKQINSVADQFLKAFPNPAVFCFYGSMGAGKTTFIQALCEKLKVVDVVNSPSFAIVNEYKREEGTSVFHFDFYRLKEEEEAYDLGYEDYFYSGNYCFVEWPEKIDSLLPANRYDVHVEVLEDMSRTVSVEEIRN